MVKKWTSRHMLLTFTLDLNLPAARVGTPGHCWALPVVGGSDRRPDVFGRCYPAGKPSFFPLPRL